MRRLITAGLLLASAQAGALDLNALKSKLNELTQPSAPTTGTPAKSGLEQFSA